MSDAPPDVKCVVWDLDGTVWDAVAVERLTDEELRPRADVLQAMRTLAGAGIVNSLASRTDPAVADVVRRHDELWSMLVRPQLGWEDKSVTVRRIADGLGIALDSVLLVDDSAFERAEVAHALPGVRTLDREGLLRALAGGGIAPATSTPEAAARTRRYQQEEQRERARDAAGSHEDFLRSCQLRMQVRAAGPGDVDRIAELSRRTHRLNSSGVVYDAEGVTALLDDADVLVVVASLTDTFGDYGTVGACVARCRAAEATVELLTVSCRVTGRGAGGAFLLAVLERLRARGVGRVGVPVQVSSANVELRVLLRRLGFAASGPAEGDVATFGRSLDDLPASVSDWIEVTAG